MQLIYSFLQKRKMHESHHGIIMVVIAYAISALLLVLGSDIFYNIRSTADTNADTLEETKEIALQDTSDYPDPIPFRNINTALINPYKLDEEFLLPGLEEQSNSSDTVWLLGSAMDRNTYDVVMKQVNDYYSQITAEEPKADKADSAGQASGKEKNNEKDTIESFSVEVASSDTKINVASEEVTMLERIVEAEAGGEDMVGKILVANVIFNRIASKQFPDSVEKVIFQRSDDDYQFSPVGSGRYWKVKISKETKEAVKRAMEGEDYSKGALYFIAKKYSKSSNINWFENNLTRLFKHGGHEFYK